MNTKAFVTVAILTQLALRAIAYTTLDFPGWPVLIQHSQAIIVARCIATPAPRLAANNVAETDTRGLISSDIEVVSALKGATNSAVSTLVSGYRPFQNEYYLIFARTYDGSFQAFESYRIVPLGVEFYPENLKGKTLQQQIRMLLERRLNNLNRQIEEEQEEKDRLQEALHQ